MECPNCHRELLRSERNFARCRHCKKRFAFEPKTTPANLHDIAFRKIIDQLSDGGRLRYTAEQLRYRIAGRTAKHFSREHGRELVVGFIGRMIFSVFLIGIFGVIVMQVPTPLVQQLFDWPGEFNLLLVIVAAVVVVPVLALPIAGVLTRRANRFRLPVSLQQLERKLLKRWHRVYNERPVGLADAQVVARLPEEPPRPAEARAVVFCPQRAVLDCLRLNGVPQQLGVQLLSMAPAESATQQATLERLRREPTLPLLLLHDAGPEGCVLLQTVRDLLKLQPHHRIVDIGLRPAQVMGRNMTRFGTDPDKKALKMLQSRGSASPLPALAPQELKWLKDGYYSPILAVTPARLIRALEQTVARLHDPSAKMRSVSLADDEAEPEARARAVGFMSWPAA